MQGERVFRRCVCGTTPYLENRQRKLFTNDEMRHEAGQAPRSARRTVVERLERIPEGHLKSEPCGEKKHKKIRLRQVVDRGGALWICVCMKEKRRTIVNSTMSWPLPIALSFEAKIKR